MMFQGLSQGATLSILYKNSPRVADGRVLSVNTHMPMYNPSQPMALFNGPVTDITVQVGEETIPFAGLPANGLTASFPEKGVFISTDRSAIVHEVEAMASAAKQILEQVPAHQKMLSDCEKLLLDLQPERRKDAKQAVEIENLKSQLSTMSDKFDSFVEMLSAKLGSLQNKEEKT